MNSIEQPFLYRGPFEDGLPDSFEAIIREYEKDKVDLLLLYNSCRFRYEKVHKKLNPKKSEMFSEILEEARNHFFKLFDCYELFASIRKDLQQIVFDEEQELRDMTDIDRIIKLALSESSLDTVWKPYNYQAVVNEYTEIRKQFFVILDTFNLTLGGIEECPN